MLKHPAQARTFHKRKYWAFLYASQKPVARVAKIFYTSM